VFLLTIDLPMHSRVAEQIVDHSPQALMERLSRRCWLISPRR